MAEVTFIEEGHQYLSDKGELVSVSKFTERFKEKQNWDEIAKKAAAKLTRNGTPTTVQQLQAKWAHKRDQSAAVGTLFHSIMEEELINTSEPVFYNRPCKKEFGCSYEGAKNSIPIHELQNDTVYPELMIYDMDYMICGQSDKVIVVDNKIHIWDYKTDLEILFKGFSNEWTSARKLVAPLDHLDECNGNLYSIKMSLYMYLLWKANKGAFKPGDIIIEHIHLKRDPLNDNIPVLEDGRPVVLKKEMITLPYRKREVIEMLKTLK
jgi:hypothetical protein